MNFSNILSDIARVEPEVYEQSSPRRNVLKTWMRGLTLAALPLAAGGLMNKAEAKNSVSDPILDALNFLLKYKYLEREFYLAALQRSVGPPASNDPFIPSGLPQSAILEIDGQEMKHEQCLIDNISRYAPGMAIPKPNFDFTAGGAFPTIFDDYDLFLAVAQVLEDTAVRVFKTVLPLLVTKHDLMSTLLRIHSVEGRHAAHIRTMRRDYPSPYNSGVIKPWIVGNVSNIATLPVQSAYDGEDLTLQTNIQIVSINGLPIITSEPATAAFDEPTLLTTVDAFVNMFIVP